MQKSNLRNLKKKPTLNYDQMSLFHANMMKKNKNPNFKGKSKQTYSSFIIKMLDETPINFNKSIKKISNTAYKNLFKKKTGFSPFNTNYSPVKKNTTSSFGKVLNKIEKKIIQKNQELSRGKNKSIISPIKLINENANLNLIDSDRTRNSNLKNYSSTNFQISNNFQSPSKIGKKGKILNTYNNIKKKRLNDLYGYDSNFVKSKNNLLRKKESFDLGNYQNEVLKVSQRNLSKDYMIKLFTELQFIKKDVDLVKPLPPINYRALVTHCFKGAEDKKKIEPNALEPKGFNNLDEYEKELYMIKKTFTFKREKTKKNRRMYKIYEILPEYVIDALYKKRNRQINF